MTNQEAQCCNYIEPTSRHREEAPNRAPTLASTNGFFLLANICDGRCPRIQLVQDGVFGVRLSVGSTDRFWFMFSLCLFCAQLLVIIRYSLNLPQFRYQHVYLISQRNGSTFYCNQVPGLCLEICNMVLSIYGYQQSLSGCFWVSRHFQYPGHMYWLGSKF